MKIWIMASLLALGAAFTGCGSGSAESAGAAASGDDPAVLVLAAADLQAAFEEVRAQFEGATGQKVTIVFGSTGNFTTQIANGAPADVFFAANESFLDRLATAGLIEEETRRIYALGRLALVWHRAAARPSSVADLGNPGFKTIAIANPEHAPYGVAAREALQAAEIWEQVRPRLVYGENIAQTYQFVQTGNADAAIVALSLVHGPEAQPHVVVPHTDHAPLRQAAAVIRASPRAEAARRFLDFVTSPEGQEILRRYGFDPPVP